MHKGRTDGWDERDEDGAQDGHVATSAANWATKANTVVKKIRRDSDAGVLPPSQQARDELRSEMLEWEKVDRAV